MINRVVLVGRLTRDPELKHTTSGNTVAKFAVAVDNRQKNPDGTKSATYVECAAFQQTADFVFKFARKGNLVGVEGRLNQSNFVRQDGSKASKLEVICDSVQLLTPKGANDVTGENEVINDAPIDSVEENNLDSLDLPDNDLPF